MDPEIEKTVVFKLGEIIDYAPGQVVVKPIYKQSTGHISLICIDQGKNLDAKASAFNTFLYVIEDSAELLIDKISRTMQTGKEWLGLQMSPIY